MRSKCRAIAAVWLAAVAVGWPLPAAAQQTVDLITNRCRNVVSTGSGIVLPTAPAGYTYLDQRFTTGSGAFVLTEVWL